MVHFKTGMVQNRSVGRKKQTGIHTSTSEEQSATLQAVPNLREVSEGVGETDRRDIQGAIQEGWIVHALRQFAS